MGTYRISRNVEASVIDFLETKISDGGWTGIDILKGFPEEYENRTPFIGVEVLDRPVNWKEIGSKSIFNDVIITIRIFAENNGQRLDLTDYLLPEILDGINYYTYTITSGTVSDKTLAGKINTIEVSQNKKELTNIDNLVKEDRYRHIFVLECRVSIT